MRHQKIVAKLLITQGLKAINFQGITLADRKIVNHIVTSRKMEPVSTLISPQPVPTRTTINPIIALARPDSITT